MHKIKSIFKKITQTKSILGFFVFLLIFVASFIFVYDFVFAIDDNIYPSPQVCLADYCDTTQGVCLDYGFKWTVNGYPGGAGNPQCCGDDSQENYVTRIANNIMPGVSPSFSSSLSDNACCLADSNTYCVYSGICRGDKYKISDAICIDPQGAQSRAWYDCDDSDGYNDFCNYCGFGDQIKSGESGVGEYPSVGSWSCCGDDANEYSSKCTDDLYLPGVGCDSNDKACCSVGNRCEYNGACYNVTYYPALYGQTCSSSGVSCVDTGDISNDLEICTSQGTGHFWMDADYNGNGGSYVCGALGKQWFDSGSNCNNAGPGGICDDADGGAFCCGDDTGENYQTRQTDKTCSGNNCPSFSRSSSDQVCCSNANYCVYNSSCYNYTNFLTVGGSKEFCATANQGDNTVPGTWYDPDAMKLGGGEDVFMCEYMNYDIAKAGESGVGEYSDQTTSECCGDDANEYYAELCPGVTGVESKCCNSSGDKINSAGQCVFTCNQPPTVSLVSPSDGATCQNYSSLTLTWTASDPNGDALTSQIYTCKGTTCNPTLLAATPNQTYTLTNLDTNSTYRWRIIVSDGQGGSATSPIRSFTTKQTTPPTYTITDNVNLNWNTSDTISVSWLDSLSGQYAYSSNSVCNASDTFSNGNSITINSTYNEYICFKATTSCGSTTYSSALGQVKVDTAIPVVNSFSGSPTSICSGESSTLSWNASDTGGSGINRVEVWQKVGTGTWERITSGTCSGDKTAIGFCSVSPTATSQYGIHAVDNAGNMGTEASPITITIKTLAQCNTDPIITLISPTNNATCQNYPSLNLVWDGYDANGDSLTYDVYTCSSGPTCNPSFLGSTTAESYTLNNLSSNTLYNWKVRVWDGLAETWSTTWNLTTKQCALGTCCSNGCTFDSPTTSCGTNLCSADSCCPAGVKYCDYPITGSLSRNSCTNYCDGAGLCSTCSTTSGVCEPNQTCSQSCGSECDSASDCTATSQCLSTIYQTRSASCSSSCSCNYGGWTTGTCQQSFTNCSAQCYTGLNCNTTNNVCACNAGYYPNGSGGCTLGNVQPNKPTNLSQSPGAEASWTNDNTPYVDFTISDPNTGDIVGYQILIDNDSNFSSPVINYTWSGSTTNPKTARYDVPNALNDGSYYWRVRAKDGAGLYSNWADDDYGFDSSGIDFKVDATAPNCGTVSYNPSGWTNGNVTVSIACSDAGSGCVQNPYQTTVSVNGSGSIIIYDNAGNSKTCAYNVTNIDKTAPTVSNAVAHCDSYTDICEIDNDTEIYFTWIASDSGGSGLTKCYAEIGDDTPDEDAGLDWQDIDTGSAGTNTYYVWCVDNAGNYSNVIFDTIDINLDPNAPTISFNPSSRNWASSDVSVLTTATDVSGVSYVHYCWTTNATCDPGTSLSNDAPFTCSGSSPCSASPGKNENGSWNLCARARDTENNWNSSPICAGRYSIDKNLPKVDSYSVNTETANFTTQDTSLDIRWVVSDTGGSGLNQVEVWYNQDSGSWQEIVSCRDTSVSGSSANNNSNPCVHNITCGHDYKYGIHVKDKVNNEADESTSGLTIITATVNCPSEPDFSISSSPTSRSVEVGQAGNYTIALTAINGFSDTVSLSAINCPSSANCSFAPSSLVPSANSILTISNAQVGGPYNVTARGISSSKTHDTSVSLTVTQVPSVNNAPNDPISLAQFDYNGSMPESSITNDNTPYFTFNISDSDSGDIVGYQIQIDDNSLFNSPSIDFTWNGSTTNPNSVNFQVPNTCPGSGYTICNAPLSDINYYWRVRAKDGDGAYSNWATFGTSMFDFTVDTTVAGAPAAEFSACLLSSDTVLFIDESTDADGQVVGWDWDFGDSQTCTAGGGCNEVGYNGTNQNPAHTFVGTGGGCVSLYNETRVAGAKESRTEKEIKKLRNREIKDNENIQIQEKQKKSFLKKTWEFVKKLFNSEKSLAYNPAWGQSKSITINYTGSPLTNYAVKIDVNYLSGMQDDFDDIRFVDSDDTTELSYWRQEYIANTSAIFWVKIPNIPDCGKVIYMYYDKNGVSTTSNGINTFVFFSDFEQNTNGWALNPGPNILNERSTVRKYQGNYSLRMRDTGDSRIINWHDESDTGLTKFAYMYWQNIDWMDNPPGSISQVSMRGETWDQDYGGVNNRKSNDHIYWITSINGSGVDTGVSFSYDTWEKYEIKIDVANDSTQVLKNNTLIYTGDLYNSGTGPQWYLYRTYLMSMTHDSGSEFYVDNFVIRKYTGNGVAEPTASFGAGAYSITLTATDNDSKTNSKIKTLDFAAQTLAGNSLENCDFSFDLTNLSSNNCNLASGSWGISLVYNQSDNYTVKRCVNNCSSFANYSSISPTKSCTSLGCSFDDATTNSNTTYYYIISNLDDLNNSRISPNCNGGQQPSGAICPLNIATPICQAQNLLATHKCGSITLDWQDNGESATYKIKRCVGKSNGSACTPTELLSEYDAGNCSGGRCEYIDKEVIPINTAVPSDKNYYCYGIVSVNSQGLESSVSDAICDYSYCYRAPNWQER